MPVEKNTNGKHVGGKPSAAALQPKDDPIYKHLVEAVQNADNDLAELEQEKRRLKKDIMTYIDKQKIKKILQDIADSQ